MPIPVPNDGETQEEFIRRCMSNNLMVEDFPDEKQRFAVCMKQYNGGERMRKSNKEYRLMEVRAVADPPDNEMVVEGYAIRFNEPAVFDFFGQEYREIIDPGALNGADLRDVPFKYNHSDSVMIMARTRNKTLELIPGDKGLFIRAKLADTTAGRDLYTLIKRGDIDKMSFAFTVADDGDEYDRSTRTRIIKRIKKIWDVAAVDTPAYDTTSISARSFFELEREKERKALEREARRKKLLIMTYL